jgi:hypothetical protein
MPTHRPFLLVNLLAALWPLLGEGPGTPPGMLPEPEWPSHFQGQPLTRLPLSRAEARFGAGFPGQIARFTDGSRELMLRRVVQPTRRLHPAADCYRGLGYRVGESRIVRNGEDRRWRCFTARRPGAEREVCERIYGPDGRSWTDASSWYWDATLGHSEGPWWAITVAGGT